MSQATIDEMWAAGVRAGRECRDMALAVVARWEYDTRVLDHILKVWPEALVSRAFPGHPSCAAAGALPGGTRTG